ncbi:MAG: NUDIX hydrolase [Planctomycetota bacterium]
MKSARLKRSLVQRLVARGRRWLTGRNAGWWESAGGLVFNARREVALIRQPRRWTFPKGRRDPGEALAATARREVHEETGLRARILDYLGMVEGARHETHYYLMALEADDDDHDDEVDKVSFVPVKKARRLLHSGIDRRLLGRALGSLDPRDGAGIGKP